MHKLLIYNKIKVYDLRSSKKKRKFESHDCVNIFHISKAKVLYFIRINE